MNVRETGSAVSAESIAVGVSNDAAFETLAARMNGYGEVRVHGHVYAPTIVPCGDRWCARCTKSAPSGRDGEPQPTDEGRPPIRSISTVLPDGSEGERLERVSVPYDPEITGNVDEAVRATDGGPKRVRDSYLGDRIENIMDAGRRGTGHGGSRTKRVPKKPRPFTGQERLDQHLKGNTPFDEPRPALVGARVSQRVHDALLSGEVSVSAGEVVNVVVRGMLEAGVSLVAVQKWLVEQIAIQPTKNAA